MQPQILILAFGNPGRQDDGVGPRCAELLKQLIAGQCPPLPVSIESNYQLSVEDSLTISQAEKVVFIDADLSLTQRFQFTALEPQPETHWNYHQLSPRELLWLTSTLYSAAPQGFLLAIKGYQFGHFEERLSQRAEANVHNACQYLHNKLQQWTRAS